MDWWMTRAASWAGPSRRTLWLRAERPRGRNAPDIVPYRSLGVRQRLLSPLFRAELETIGGATQYLADPRGPRSASKTGRQTLRIFRILPATLRRSGREKPGRHVRIPRCRRN